MVAVIADDLTGAAELGGIGIRHGLKTEIRLTIGDSTSAGLLVIAADSRSKNETAAIEEMTRITRDLRRLKPEFIYKKTDSVLRGHVVAELKVHLQILDCPLALLIPANPSLGRTIRDGHYYLNGEPIHQSSFSIDPEFPILSSDIQDMLHAKNQPVPIRKFAETLPVRGIVVGEAQSEDDLHHWTKRIPPKTLLAGAAGFFSAILDAQYPNVPPHSATLGTPALYVSGSTFNANRNLIRERAAKGDPVTWIFSGSWQQQILDNLKIHGKSIVAIEPIPQNQSALQLRNAMASSIAPILRAAQPAELIIEGGSTAYAILQQMGWRQFIPEQEFAQGIVRMSVPDAPGLHITVKPGSYAWPPSIRY
ncbi:MAG TPA: four-carbon acid sugar kinase family protein [Puia sp.]|uniref:four-carbon acid sugar kinase family protein n=1 Tax=Puia sp. TaxID=2045100 RepID=UPI002D031BF4|nr:four-carbon acid sugar kinase family protein [Puia sp.]HVU98294.1 four-carbon acid sugar kinase family protein [Puia sp.]